MFLGDKMKRKDIYNRLVAISDFLYGSQNSISIAKTDLNDLIHDLKQDMYKNYDEFEMQEDLYKRLSKLSLEVLTLKKDIDFVYNKANFSKICEDCS